MKSHFRPLPKPLVLALALAGAGPAAAFQFDTDYGVKGSFDTTVSYGISVRASDRELFAHRHRERRDDALGERRRRQPQLRQEQALRQHRQGHRRTSSSSGATSASSGAGRPITTGRSCARTAWATPPGTASARTSWASTASSTATFEPGGKNLNVRAGPAGDQLGREHVHPQRHQLDQPGGPLEAARPGVGAEGGVPAHGGHLGQPAAHQQPERGGLLPHQPRQDPHRPAGAPTSRTTTSPRTTPRAW